MPSILIRTPTNRETRCWVLSCSIRYVLLAAVLIFALGNFVSVSTAAPFIYSYDSLNRLTNVNYGNGAVISYTYDAVGNRLTYTGVVTNDAIAPSIAITSPTSSPTYNTTNASINLSGTASDNTGVSLITWENFYGYGIGTASGTNNWSITGIPLHLGDNYLFITAYDLAGNSTEADLTVTYALPVGPSIQSSFSSGNLNLSWPASAGDFVLQTATNLTPPVTWSNVVATITTNGGTLNINLPTTNGQQFFRLKQ